MVLNRGVSPLGTLTKMSPDISGCHLGVSGGCSTPCRAQDGPTIKNDLVPPVDVAEAEEPWPEASLSRTLIQVNRVNDPHLIEHLSK